MDYPLSSQAETAELQPKSTSKKTESIKMLMKETKLLPPVRSKGHRNQTTQKSLSRVFPNPKTIIQTLKKKSLRFKRSLLNIQSL